jgi:hypothetical protein
MMQPIVHRGLVFVASQEGMVFAIRDNGATAWKAALPGGARRAPPPATLWCSRHSAVGFKAMTSPPAERCGT